MRNYVKCSLHTLHNTVISGPMCLLNTQKAVNETENMKFKLLDMFADCCLIPLIPALRWEKQEDLLSWRPGWFTKSVSEQSSMHRETLFHTTN